MKRLKNRLPKGWTLRQVNALARHYENQSDDQAAREDDAAYESTTVTMIAVPVELVSRVQKLIARRAG